MKVNLKVEIEHPQNHVPFFVPKLLKTSTIIKICNQILNYNQNKVHRLHDIVPIENKELLYKTVKNHAIKELSNIDKWLYFIEAKCGLRDFKLDEELSVSTFEGFIKRLDKLTMNHLHKFKNKKLIHLLEKAYNKEKQR